MIPTSGSESWTYAVVFPFTSAVIDELFTAGSIDEDPKLEALSASCCDTASRRLENPGDMATVSSKRLDVDGGKLVPLLIPAEAVRVEAVEHRAGG